MFAELMNLRMTVMAAGNAIGCTGFFYLLIFQFSIRQALLFKAGLEKAAAAAAAEIVGLVGIHVNKIFFSHKGFGNESQILSDGIAVAFTDNLTRILNRKLDLEIFVPIGVDLQFSFPYPFCIVFIDIFDDKIVLNIKFFQSCQD
jgi:hypothetical protein